MTRDVKDRRKCFERHRYVDALGRTVMDCHLCSAVIQPAIEKWDAEHVIPDAFDGTDIRPAHVACHAVKTKKDVKDIAKAKRVHEKHFGIRRARGFRKPPAGYKYDWPQRCYIREEEL